MYKIKGGQFGGRKITQNYTGIVKRFVASDNKFTFMSFVK